MAARVKGGRRGRWIRRILLGSLGFLVLLAATGMFLVGTGAGGRIVLSLVRGFLPAELELDVSGLSGRLADRFELEGVRIGTPTVAAEASRVIVEWRAFGLLRKRIDIRLLSVDGLEVDVRPAPSDSSALPPDATSDAAETPPGENFPYDVELDSVRVSGLTIRMRDTVWLSGGSATLSGTPEDYRLSFSGRGVVPGLAAGDVALDGAGSRTGFHVASVEIAALEGVISGSADVTWWPALSWAASLEGAGLHPASMLPRPDEWPGQVSFTARTTGRMSPQGDLELEAATDTLFGVLRGERLDGRFDLRVKGDEIDVDAARVTWGPATLRAAGRVGATIDADFEATVPDLGLVVPGASGSLSAAGRATGTLDAPRIHATFAADSLRADPVSAAEVEGEADIDLSGRASGMVRVRDLAVSERRFDSATVVLSGRADRHQLALSVRGPDGTLDLGAAGGLTSAGVWNGTLESLRLAADSGQAWALEEPVALRASRTALKVGEACFASPPARLCISGERDERHTKVRLAADSLEMARLDPLMPPDFSVRTVVNGLVDVEYASGGEITGTADVRTGPGHVEWGADGESRTLWFDPVILTAASGSDGLRGEAELHVTDSAQVRLLDISGHVESPVVIRATRDLTHLRGQPVALRLEVDASDLGLLTATVLRRWDVTGRFRAVVDVAADAEGRLQGTLDAGTDSLVLRNTVRGRGWVLAAEPARLQATVGPEGLTAALDFEVSTTGSESLLAAHGRLTVPQLNRLDVDPETLPIEGRLDVEVLDLSFVEAILAQLSDVTGTFQLHTEIGGTLADATVRGEASLRDGRVRVPDLGLDLNAIQLAVTGQPEGGLDVEGEARSGSGQIAIRGRSERYPSPDEPTSIQVRGEQFRAVDIPEVQIDADPDLVILFDGRVLQVNGQVRIPRGRIGIPELPAAAITPSEDVLIVGDTTTVKEPPVPFGADLTVTLGDAVFFDGFGLTGNLVGEVNVKQPPGGQPTGRGELRLVNGKYLTLGQELRVDPGRLLFNGPIEDPGVDARAFVRASDQTEAGFQIRGTVKDLDVSTYSVPPKPESDIIAYILFGRPMSETTGVEGSEASNTAAILGANVLAMSLAPSLGLDEARIDTGTSQNKAQLVVGKYLSPRLYLGYGVGIYEPISTFRVRYLLSARWSIEAITGDQQSTDLLYRIERGGPSTAQQPASGSETAE